MNNIVCNFINPRELRLDAEEISKRLKTPNPLENQVIHNCTERILDVCKPRYCYAKTSVLLNEEGCILDFADVKSQSLKRVLCGCQSAYVTAITLGMETDRFISKLAVTSKGESFIADGIASALAEAVVEYVNSLFGCENLTERFSAGYGDFVLSNQEKILDYLKADKLLGIKLSSNYIMTPRKSVTAIIGVK